MPRRATRISARALRAYETRAARRVARAQREARRNAWRYHLAGPLGWRATSSLARMGGEKLVRRYDWLYGWHAVEMTAIASSEGNACSRPPSPAACRSRPGSPSPTSCGRSGAPRATSSHAAKGDATLLALKEQEDAGIDIVGDGEQSRQHFVHGFLEHVEGIDFAHKVEMGIRADRYKAMVPQVVGALRLKGRVHATEARLARAHTKQKLKFTLPGPMTIVDTIADRHYGDKVKMAMAFAGLLNQEARALEADGVDVIQFDEPAFNVYMDEVTDWGIEALHRGDRGPHLHHRRAHLLRLRHQGQHRLEGDARRRVAAVRGDLSRRWPRAASSQVSLECRNSKVPLNLIGLLDGKDVLVGVIDVASDDGRDAGGGRGGDRRAR